MSFQAIENAITTYLQAIANIHGLSVRYFNDPRETPTKGIWLKCIIENDDSRIHSIGVTNIYRHSGNLIIEVYNEINLGTAYSLRTVDNLVGSFTGLTVSNLVKFRTPSVNLVGRVEDNYQINITCPFYVDN